MSYIGISIREVLEKINASTNGWYLPQVQRQFVWGARHESETYICLLLDSLFRRYPIGGIVLWETEQEVPYRRFVGDYKPGQFALQVDEGLWGAAKSLVYDGQQRLQTLYSVLRHRFNGRVLHFDLVFDPAEAEADETGFLFRDSNASRDPRYIRMTELSCLTCNEDEKIALEDRALPAANDDKNTKLLVRKNLSTLWSVFVESSHKSIAYFPVKAESPKEVNEVFRRLNTGGVALTQLELVLGEIKAVHSDYEEKLWALSERIEGQSGGIKFSSASLLQFFHLLVKDTIRIDESRLKKGDVEKFRTELDRNDEPLIELFSRYLNGLMSINHASIVPSWLAVLPLATYLTFRRRSGFKWRIRELSKYEIELFHKYFLFSQFCDWNTQTMINAFSSEAIAAAKEGRAFPFEEIRAIAIKKNRTGDLHEYQFSSEPWLATKVLMPNRSYVFHENKPQVDHIFPVNLAGGDEEYKVAVDVLWNLQPMPAEVNNYKRARHPKEYFESEDGNKYWASYDFIPPVDDPLWSDHLEFVQDRKSRMVKALKDLYDLDLSSEV